MRTLILFLCLASVALSQQPAVKPTNSYPLDLKQAGITLPETQNPELQRIFNSKSTIYYKLQQVWQHYVPSSKIEYVNTTLGTKSYFNTNLIYGVYFASHDPDWHANANFPWETTVGLNSINKEYKGKENENPYGTINFVNLPEENGKPKPILILTEFPVKWIFPTGTTVGEIIYVTHEGKKYIQEIRTRQKAKDSQDWNPMVYRPIESKAEFEAVTGYKDHVYFQKHFHFRNPQEDEVFKMDGLVERLPNMPPEKVKELLSRPFKEIKTDWSPAADQDFHVLPRNYCFSLLGSIDSVSCANCHRQTQISVRNLTPKDPDVVKTPNRIGNIRGSDAVFTWHPFEPKTVRTSDKDTVRPTARKYDIDNGFIIFSDDAKDYKLTKFVQESLKPYELPSPQYLHEESKPADKAE